MTPPVKVFYCYAREDEICLTALEAMSDLYGIVAKEAVQEWLKDSRTGGTIADEMRNPWDS